MPNYLPPPTPEQAARIRAQRIKAAVWIAAIPFIVFALMAIGYSDAAPAWVRRAVIEIDAMVGSPVWSILDPRGGK
jgi:hypothetical protein